MRAHVQVINQAPVSARNTASSDTSAGGNVNNKSIRVHRGMLHSARYVCQQIDKQNILNDMFVLYPNFQLVITGHSLGAGVAVVVALLLRCNIGVRVYRCTQFVTDRVIRHCVVSPFHHLAVSCAKMVCD
jgi:predicted lipase